MIENYVHQKPFLTIDEDVETYFATNSENLLVKSAADINNINLHIENLETYLNLFKSDLYDLTKESDQKKRNSLLNKESFFENRSQLLSFYQVNSQKLDKYKEIAQNKQILRRSNNKSTNINLDLNEPLILLNSHEHDFYKTSTPRMTNQEANNVNTKQVFDSLIANSAIKTLKLKEEFKHVATVNDTSIEIKILSKQKDCDFLKIEEETEKENVKIKIDQEPKLENNSVEEIFADIKEEHLPLLHEHKNKFPKFESNDISENEPKLKVIDEEKAAELLVKRNAPKVNKPKSTLERVFSVTQALCYFLLFSLLFLFTLLISLPLIISTCCNYKPEFLIFNHKTYGDEPLPF